METHGHHLKRLMVMTHKSNQILHTFAIIDLPLSESTIVREGKDIQHIPMHTDAPVRHNQLKAIS